MSEIVVANLFFDSDKNTGIIGGTTADTFTIRAGSVDQLVTNSTSITFPGSAVYSGNASYSGSNIYFNATSVTFVGNSTFSSANVSGNITFAGNATYTGTAVYTGNADFSSANVVGVGGISTGKAIAMAIVFGG